MIKNTLKKILPKHILIFYRNFKSNLSYIKFRIKLYSFRWQKKEISIIVGAADNKYNLWISTNYPWFDITNIKSFKKFFIKREVSKILAEHVFEHLSEEDGANSIRNLKSILKINGKIRIAVPDGYNPNKNYIDHVKPGGVGPGADDHKILYNYNTIKKIFDDDFKVKLLEYFDEDGNFISKNWINDDKNGFIKRSRFNDKRNTKDKIFFNSIILDAELMK